MNSRSIHMLLVLLTSGAIVLSACQAEPEAPPVPDMLPDAEAEADTVATAHAQLVPTEGSNVTGMVSFTETAGGVRVEASVTGLGEGLHGFHVHEVGDCSAPDATSAGDHFAGSGTVHGGPTDPVAERHAGDLGNIEVAAGGVGHYERVDHVLSLRGPESIIGKAVIVHADEDDLESQPSGAAGARLACGVITSGTNPSNGMR